MQMVINKMVHVMMMMVVSVVIVMMSVTVMEIVIVMVDSDKNNVCSTEQKRPLFVLPAI